MIWEWTYHNVLPVFCKGSKACYIYSYVGMVRVLLSAKMRSRLATGRCYVHSRGFAYFERISI